MQDEKQQEQEQEPTPDQIPGTLPLIPLRDVVIFPYMIFPVLVGRESSIAAVTEAIEKDKFLFVCAQRDPEDEEPNTDGLFPSGTVARILQVLKLPNGLMKVLVDGLFQATATNIRFPKKQFYSADIEIITPPVKLNTELKALMRQLDAAFEEYVRVHRDIPNESLFGYENIDEPQRKLYYVSANLLVDIETRQSILEISDVVKQYYHLMRIIHDELAILKVEHEIDEKANEKMQTSTGIANSVTTTRFSPVNTRNCRRASSIRGCPRM